MCKFNPDDGNNFYCDYNGESITPENSNCPNVRACLEELYVATMLDLHGKMFQEMFLELSDDE